MSNWETDIELQRTSRFVKFVQGTNSLKFANDGDKVRGNDNKPTVEFTMSDGKILSVKPSPLLDAIAEAKKKYGTLVGRTLAVTRTGTGQADTRYTDIKVV